MKPYIGIKNELTVSEEELILRGSRVVIPESLRKQIIQIGHEGHQGIEKTRQQVSQFVWFPKLNWLCENFVKNCRVCQANSE